MDLKEREMGHTFLFCQSHRWKGGSSPPSTALSTSSGLPAGQPASQKESSTRCFPQNFVWGLVSSNQVPYLDFGVTGTSISIFPNIRGDIRKIVRLLSLTRHTVRYTCIASNSKGSQTVPTVHYPVGTVLQVPRYLPTVTTPQRRVSISSSRVS